MKIERSANLVVAAVVLGLALIVTPSATQVRAEEKTVEDVNRLIGQGRREVQQKQYARAIVTFSAALQTNPDARTAAEIHGERGGAYVDKGELDKAMADGEAAVRLAPGYFRGYQVRGRVYRHRKEFDRALAEFGKALKLAPDFAQLYNNRGNVFSDKGEEERAIQDFSEAIRRAPGTIDGYVNRGGSYIAIGQFDKAIVDLDQAIRIDPRDSDSYLNRGIAHRKKQDYRSAMADYVRANELAPRDPDILNAIAWLKATCPIDGFRNGKEALEASLEACGLTGFKNANKLDTLATAYAEVGDFDRAIQYMTKLLDMKIDSTDRKEFVERRALYRNRKPYRDIESANHRRGAH
jgi:tetratricopeptide (TPR) repeat protein